MHLCCQQKDLQEGGDAEAADVASASEALWLELRKAIPDAEEDGMTLRDYRALTQVLHAFVLLIIPVGPLGQYQMEGRQPNSMVESTQPLMKTKRVLYHKPYPIM